MGNIVKRFGVEVKLNQVTYDKTVRSNAKWVSLIGLFLLPVLIIADFLTISLAISVLKSYSFAYEPFASMFGSIFFNLWWSSILVGVFTGIKPEIVRGKAIPSKVYVKDKFLPKDILLLLFSKVSFLILFIFIETLIVS